jgi:16S rRNA (adenine1518-N6/adenine1519-N6)-dimethyltransferase
VSVTRPNPNRELGQNFLVDSNLLDVIGRLAELDERDVVLEVGGGLGVLSEYLAPRAAFLHVVEVDRALEPALRDALDPFANAALHLADATELDLPALAPAPTKVVANLPYGIAVTAILRTIEELPGATRWVVMTQREVARNVFHPVPNVDSVLVVLERRGPAASPEVRALARAAFAHRRKALAGSLALAHDAPEGVRERARAALEEMGLAADARAERLAPGEFEALARSLA